MEPALPVGALLWICLTAVSVFAARAVVAALSGRNDENILEASGFGKTNLVRERDDMRLSAWIVYSGCLFAFILICLQYLSRQDFIIALTVVFAAGEILAPITGRSFSDGIVRAGRIPMRVLRYLFWPALKLGRMYQARVAEAEEKKRKKYVLEELSSALEAAEKAGDTEESEEDTHIFKGIVGFSETETCEIMKPRMDIVALPISATYAAVMDKIQESEYSRMPVYDGDLDHIKGILYIKDLLPYLARQERFEWQKLVRPAIFVPETRKIEQLLKDFKKKRLHIAVVVDEYGGTSGIVTLEDILEEVVGEINDEFDTLDDDRLYQKTESGAYLFDGRMPIHDLSRLLNLDDDYFDIEEGDYESLAGLILEITGYFPPKGTAVAFKDFLFTVEAVGNNRITRIKMTPRPDEDEQE